MHATRILGLALLGLVGTACYSTPEPDCGFACGPAGECPSDYQCGSDNRCHRNGTPASLVCSVDAPPQPDARLIDAPDADVTPPAVKTWSPADSATNVPTTTIIQVEFNEGVVGVSATSFTVNVGASQVSGLVGSSDSTRYAFTPDTALPGSATVTASLSNAITDVAGNPLVPVSISFTTGP